MNRRTLHDLPRRSPPLRLRPEAEAHDVYVRLSQLASERRRLEAELRLWRQKTDQVATRLSAVEVAMRQLERRLPEGAVPEHDPGLRRWREVEVRY